VGRTQANDLIMISLKSKQYESGLDRSLRAAPIMALLLISGCGFLPERPPYPDPDRLVSVVKIGSAGEEPVLGADFVALRIGSRTLFPVAAYLPRSRTISGGPAPERIQSAMVSEGFFLTLEVFPEWGRVLIPNDNRAGKDHVAVISYELWARRFSADLNVIGKTIQLDHEQHTVVGVMPAGFRFPKWCDIWTPLAQDDEGLPSTDKSLGLEVIARMRPDVTLDQAQTEASVIARKLERDRWETNTGREIRLTALREIRIPGEKTIKSVMPANPPAETGKGK
jgi:hypothetical protein